MVSDPRARGRAIAVVIGLACALWCGTAAAAEPEPACADFLQQMNHRPAVLEFLGCRPDHAAQVRVLRASYRVRGPDAHAVERYLRRHTGMPRLRFMCCGWHMDPADKRDHGILRNGTPFPYEVSMGSDETLVNRRPFWGDIPWFHVEVLLALEMP